jgi:glycosyltransferase involved in cell wall biosynthesis
MSALGPSPYNRVAVVIPACNERPHLSACLRAVVTAALCVHIPVAVVVVLDSSDDDSADLAGQFGPDVHFVRIEAKNVGAARAAGFAYARSVFAERDEWYATTDADSQVDPDWLVHQLERDADMVLGVVRITDWRHHSLDFAERYVRAYQPGPLGRDGHHNHVHGANMGFSARAYWQVGGFRALTSGEDVDLVARFEDAGYRICRDPDLSVMTSARTQARAPHGFAHYLTQLRPAGDAL